MYNPSIQETLRPESTEQIQPVLWESKELCQSLFAHATDGLFLVSRDGRYVAVNQKYTEIAGKEHKDLIGQPIDLLLPDEMRPATAWVERILREGTFGPSEIEVTTPLGLKVFSVSAFAYREGGVPIGIMGTVRDVTEEHRHKEHETVYQLAYDLARATDLRSITAHLFARTQGLLRTDYEFLMFADGAGRELTGVAARGIDSEAFRQERVAVNKEISPVAQAFQQKLPVVVTEWAHSLRVSERLRQQYSFLGSLWVVPLMSGEKAIGVLALGYGASKEATGAELRLLQMLGDEAALAIERARVTEELRESEDRYHSLVENAHDGIICLTADGIVTSVNRGFEALLGWSREELIGKHYQTRHTPSSLALQEDRIRRLQAGEKVPSLYEVELVHKDGRGVPCEVRTRFIRNTAGKPIGVLAIVRDISARKQTEAALRESEERFRSMCTASPVGIFQNDLTGACVYTNARWQEITGLTLEESLGQGWAKAIHLEDCEGVFTEWQKSVALGREFAKEFRFVRPTGEVCWVHSQASPLRDDDGIVIGYVGVNMDITDRKEVDRMKDEFVSVVSHELRTPLTSIRGSLGLLASGRLGTLQEKGQRMLDIAVANTDRLVRLINDILDIERMQSGRATMVKVACDASELMAQTVEVMQAIAGKAGVTLSVQSQSVRLWADPDRLIQILANLLSNAIKFSPPGSQVWLTVERQKEQALFQIKDQGRGIPVEKLDSIFERFQQVDASDSRDKGGTGLGLAICRSIVQQHGGHIWVESALGEGSTFSFTLPALTRAEPSASEGSLPPAKRPVNGQRRTACVLVAEDDSDLVRVLVLMLQRYGIESFYAQTGREAIHLSQRLSPDLVILDLFMPDGDGFMVVNWLRQQNRLRHVPLIVYSAKDLDADERERLKLGPTQFLTKGRVNPEEFERRVIEFLSHLLAQREEGQNNGTQADFDH